MRRNSKIQMVELAVGITYLPGENFVVVSALVICNEVDRRRSTKTLAFVAIDVKVNLIPSNKFHPLVASDVDFSPSWRASFREGIIIEWKMVRGVFNLGRERLR